MFEGPVTGNIPEVLDNGEVTDGTHVTAGQLALALTPYAQVTGQAVNTAASGNNAAAIQSLDDRVTAELASKLDSSALAPAIAPLATAAALATTDGQVAAHGSSIAALHAELADQSAFDALEGVVATKSTPDHERFHRLGQQRHAGHGGRQLRPQDGGGPALPGHSGEDHAAGGGHQGGQRSPAGRHRRGAGLRAREQRRLRPCRASGARRAWTSWCRRAESRSCTSEPLAAPSPGWCSSRTDLYSMQIRASAFEGESVLCLSNGPAGGLAGPHGLGHAGRAHRAGQRRKLHGRVHQAVAGATLSSRGRVRQLAEHDGGGQRGPAEPVEPLQNKNSRRWTRHQARKEADRHDKNLW